MCTKHVHTFFNGTCSVSFREMHEVELVLLLSVYVHNRTRKGGTWRKMWSTVVQKKSRVGNLTTCSPATALTTTPSMMLRVRGITLSALALNCSKVSLATISCLLVTYTEKTSLFLSSTKRGVTCALFLLTPKKGISDSQSTIRVKPPCLPVNHQLQLLQVNQNL